MDTRKAAQQYRLNQWAQRIRECRSSGQTVAVWCSEHNIKLSSYFYWLKRVREAACEALPSLNAESNQIVPVDIPLTKVACFWQVKNIAFRKFKYVAPLFPYLAING